MRLIDESEYQCVLARIPMEERTFRMAVEVAQNMPTACDIEQISSARYNNGFYDGKKAMEEKLEQIRAEIAEYKDDKVIHAERNEMIDIVLEIIDKYTKGESEW